MGIILSCCGCCRGSSEDEDPLVEEQDPNMRPSTQTEDLFTEVNTDLKRGEESSSSSSSSSSRSHSGSYMDDAATEKKLGEVEEGKEGPDVGEDRDEVMKSNKSIDKKWKNIKKKWKDSKVAKIEQASPGASDGKERVEQDFGEVTIIHTISSQVAAAEADNISTAISARESIVSSSVRSSEGVGPDITEEEEEEGAASGDQAHSSDVWDIPGDPWATRAVKRTRTPDTPSSSDDRRKKGGTPTRWLQKRLSKRMGKMTRGSRSESMYF